MAESRTSIPAYNDVGDAVTIYQHIELLQTVPRGTVLSGRQAPSSPRYTTADGVPLNEPEMNSEGKRIWRRLDVEESFFER